MKQLQCNFTTQEQSKRLLELGVPADSADMCYKINYESMRFDRIPTAIPYKDFTAKEFYCPCWSVGRLMEIITTCHISKDNRFGYIDKMCESLVITIESFTRYGEMDFSKLNLL